jgi:hypothetical protein
MPVIGYLAFTSPDERPTLLAAFLKGLEQAGYVVGKTWRSNIARPGGTKSGSRRL